MVGVAWLANLRAKIAMYDRIIVVLFTFSIFNTYKIVQQQALIYVISCKNFIVVVFQPVYCSECHTKSARLIRSIPKSSSSFLDTLMSAATRGCIYFCPP